MSALFPLCSIQSRMLHPSIAECSPFAISWIHTRTELLVIGALHFRSVGHPESSSLLSTAVFNTPSPNHKIYKWIPKCCGPYAVNGKWLWVIGALQLLIHWVEQRLSRTMRKAKQGMGNFAELMFWMQEYNLTWNGFRDKEHLLQRST